MKIKKLHDWDINYRQAIELQKELAQRVRLEKLRKTPKLIAGIDCAFSKDGKRIAACAVVLRLTDFEVKGKSRRL